MYDGYAAVAPDEHEGGRGVVRREKRRLEKGQETDGARFHQSHIKGWALPLRNTHKRHDTVAPLCFSLDRWAEIGLGSVLRCAHRQAGLAGWLTAAGSEGPDENGLDGGGFALVQLHIMAHQGRQPYFYFISVHPFPCQLHTVLEGGIPRRRLT